MNLFRPAPLPPNPPIEVSGELLTKLIDANKKIATLEGLSSRIPNMGLFVSMYVRKEALLSSQIEGTQCTLEDILSPLIEITLIEMFLMLSTIFVQLNLHLSD